MIPGSRGRRSPRFGHGADSLDVWDQKKLNYRLHCAFLLKDWREWIWEVHRKIMYLARHAKGTTIDDMENWPLSKLLRYVFLLVDCIEWEKKDLKKR